jgi:Recombination endonuclease VII
MGNSKGYVPSEEAKRKTSESLKQAYADGSRVTSEETRQKRSESMRKAWESRSHTRSEESKRKTSETLKQGYAEGRIQLVGAALAQSQSPFVSQTDEERKARKLETQRIWRANNPEVVAAYKQEQNAKRYGLTVAQYEAASLCDICKRPQQGNCSLAQDHAHGCCPEKTACDKCRRGRLCTNCNTLLGSAHDNLEILAAAILYLKSFKKGNDEHAECIDHKAPN